MEKTVLDTILTAVSELTIIFVVVVAFIGFIFLQEKIGLEPEEHFN